MTAIKLYRIVKRKFAEHAFDGQGSRLYGGRWNSKGKSCVYLADSPALAMLEVLVHIEKVDLMASYVMYELEVDSKQIKNDPVKKLPANWDAEPSPPEDAAYGDAWIVSRECVALCIPSVIVPMQRNYVLNVDHPDFDGLAAGAKPIDFSFDKRLK